MEKILILFLQLYSAAYSAWLVLLIITIVKRPEAFKRPDKITFKPKDAALIALYALGAYLWFFNP